MENIRKGIESEKNYIIAFRKILQEAEEKDREAMERFRSWSNGMMEPEEDEAYTNAVKECASKLKSA